MNSFFSILSVLVPAIIIYIGYISFFNDIELKLLGNIKILISFLIIYFICFLIILLSYYFLIVVPLLKNGYTVNNVNNNIINIMLPFAICCILLAILSIKLVTSTKLILTPKTENNGYQKLIMLNKIDDNTITVIPFSRFKNSKDCPISIINSTELSNYYISLYEKEKEKKQIKRKNKFKQFINKHKNVIYITFIAILMIVMLAILILPALDFEKEASDPKNKNLTIVKNARVIKNGKIKRMNKKTSLKVKEFDTTLNTKNKNAIEFDDKNYNSWVVDKKYIEKN